MSGNDHCFVEWKEEFVSQERGNRVVHYFLKDSAGDSILAVVGTERSVRHMFYVVADEFVKAYGAEHSIHVGFKWRSRREVVDWLTSMLSKQHLPGDRYKLLKHDEYSPECTMNGFSSLKSQLPDDRGSLLRNLSVQNSDIEWSGTAWTCGKQLRHYPAFCRNGTTIAIQSFVFVMSKGENRYIAYLEDMYEDKRGLKKVRVRWFHHVKEVKGVISVRKPHPKEVFITPFSQVISAECVDGPATVLTREHFEECAATFPESFLVRVHLCSRQFRNNRVKPFDLRKLRGYFNQPIISCLSSSPYMEPDSISRGLDEEEEREPYRRNDVKVGSKRSRHAREHSGVKISRTECLTMSSEDLYKSGKYGFFRKRLFSIKQVKFQPCSGLNFKVGEKIEILCQDSGIRGCWFRCTVLHLSRKQMKVQYDDVQDEDGSDHLEEWIPAFKLAAPDKFGMRYSGRPTIRPRPPCLDRELTFDIGVAVDAWWSDGWWEGVITGVNGSEEEIQVYSPGENIFLNIPKKDLRISRDWVGNDWIDIMAKPDMLSQIFATVSQDTKISASCTTVNVAKLKIATMSPIEVPTSSSAPDINRDSVEENPDLPTAGSPRSLVEGMEYVEDKVLSLPKNENQGNDINVSGPPLNKEGEANGDGGDKVIVDKQEDAGHSEDEIHNNYTNKDGHDGDDNNVGEEDDRNEMEMECIASAQNCNVTKLMEVVV